MLREYSQFYVMSSDAPVQGSRLTCPHILPESLHRSFELGSTGVKHMPYVVIELHKILPGPSFQFMPIRQNSVTRAHQHRRHAGERTELLQSGPLVELDILRHLSFICCLRFLRGRVWREGVGGHAVHETSEIGHEQRVLDIGEGRKRGNLGI